MERIAEIIIRTEDDGTGCVTKKHTYETEITLTAEDIMMAGRSVPFTIEHMKTLLLIYDAYMELEDCVEAFLGRRDAVTYNEGIWGTLSRVEQLIHDLSPLGKYQMSVDEEETDTPFYRILDNPEMSLEERAARLLFDVID